MDENMGQLALNYFLFMMFDEGDAVNNEPLVWEKVTVNVNEYRFMSEGAFKLHFRMSRELFEGLVNIVGHKLRVDDTFHTDPEYDISHVLLMVLWVLATPDTFRSIALRFGKTPGVLHDHYLRIIGVLCELAPTYIFWPAAEEREVVKRSVQRRTGFPGVVGAVDGCEIKIATPSVEPGRYLNRHHDHSIVLQGTSDETLLFRDIYVGEPGSIHDSRVFRRSPMCRHLLEHPENFCSDDEHILGDAANILTNKVLTPFRNNGNLNENQRNYNHRHASARVVVERAFGLLKGKWRRLKFLSSINLQYAVKTVVASVVLHNFILNGEEETFVSLIS